ncbi:endolytic transglycosylase MltG [Candidatus Sumerlaeota bacterium]|nr:endolytic transglycosylase MltG [Candidatus Sumerlaeota bacterium]
MMCDSESASPPEPQDAKRDDAPVAGDAARPHKPRRWLRTVVIVLIALAGLSLLAAWAFEQALDAPLYAPAFQTQVVIRRGDSFGTIAERLTRAGLLRSKWPLVLLAMREGTTRQLQPGVYELDSSISLRELHQRLVRGAPIRLTVPEGFTLRQIAQRIAGAGLTSDPETALQLAASPEWIRSHTLIEIESLEGFLWPETYFFAPGDDAEDALRRMAATFMSQTEALRADDPPQGLTWTEAVTLASMIERETATADEMPLIASVYLNRLKRGMKLDCDATVRYALNVWERDLTTEDLRTDSPYNTYRRKGLPPGPIGSPGMTALRAALKPAESDYLYYCSKGDGTHVFAARYNDHLRNVREHLKP